MTKTSGDVPKPMQNVKSTEELLSSATERVLSLGHSLARLRDAAYKFYHKHDGLKVSCSLCEAANEADSLLRCFDPEISLRGNATELVAESDSKFQNVEFMAIKAVAMASSGIHLNHGQQWLLKGIIKGTLKKFVRPSAWISVNDGLPEIDNLSVLTAIRTNFGAWVDMNFIVGKTHWYQHDSSVTHWMRLPRLPEFPTPPCTDEVASGVE